jgi:hypothetical protein
MEISIFSLLRMKHYKKTRIKNNRLCITHSLLFFCTLLLFSCKQEGTDSDIIWQDQKAIAVFIPEKKLPNADENTALPLVAIRLKGSNTDMLGNKKWEDGVRFEPLIPFTPGSQYTVFYRGVLLDSFSIPLGDASMQPSVVKMYPSTDTVPVNMLKIYLQFSQPMRESVSPKYVGLIKDGKDTLNDVFLDLQPELWNEDRTVLTLWLDPGRIKRDLQPNQRMGNPLQENTKYTLLVAAGWTSAQGLALSQNFRHDFVAAQRDSLSPDPARWHLTIPSSNTSAPLVIDLQETLDHFLLPESIQVATKAGKVLEGKWVINEKDNQCQFHPSSPWTAGSYQLIIDAKLEDMAGNNLNKPFDRDTRNTKAPSDNTEYYRYFSIGGR